MAPSVRCRQSAPHPPPPCAGHPEQAPPAQAPSFRLQPQGANQQAALQITGDLPVRSAAEPSAALHRHRAPSALSGGFKEPAEVFSSRQQGLAAGLLKRIGNHQVGAIHQGPDLLKLLEFSAVMVGSQATAPQAHAVQSRTRPDGLPPGNRGNRSTRSCRPPSPSHRCEQTGDARTATHHCTVFNHHARHLNGIGHHDVVAQIAVVTQMQ